MKTRHLIPVFLAFGCGTVNPALVDGNQGSGVDGASSVAITSITPADGATKVGVLSKVTVQLSGDADASSVTRTSAVLTWGDSKRVVPAAVSYDATAHAITIAPSVPLQTGATYKVAITGVTAGGAPVAPASAHFLTVYNPTKYYAGLDVTGKKLSLTNYGYNADGTRAWWATATAGSDGVFGTADDGRSSYDAVTYPAAGKERFIYASGAGTDGTWGTADDPISMYIDLSYGTPGVLSDDYYNPGADGVVGNADDVATNVATFTYDAMDRSLRDAYGSAGPDGKAGTADDTVSYDYRYVYTSGADYDRVYYPGPGADGVWQTADDKPTTYEQVHRDGNGAFSSFTFRNVGADGLAETADDTTTGIWAYQLDAKEQPSKFVIYNATGADGQWGTADDVVGNYYAYTYDADGNWTEYQGWSLGADGKPFTADDYKSYSEPHDPTL
jgi:hypothetical protein